MAKRRMLDKEIINSAKFRNSPATTQLFYVYASVNADDEGFLENVQGNLRLLGFSFRAVQNLVNMGYAYYFKENDVILLRDWCKSNKIKKDRFAKTSYYEERAKVVLIEDKYYLKEEIEERSADKESDVTSPYTGDGLTSCMETQGSIGKSSTEKGSIGKERVAEDNLPEKVATKEELASLFDIRMDVSPTHPLSIYYKVLEEMNRSSFARQTIKSLSSLHRHMKEIINGEWVDYRDAKDVSKNFMPQTYTREEMTANVIDVSKLTSVDDIDI